MKALFLAALTGVLFGSGLVISGMTRADKVIDFLDVAQGWDPSLAFVMVGAIAVHVVLFRVALQRRSPLFAPAFAVPSRSDIDPRLVGGAALFGLGWGLGGYCPGPGIVATASGATNAIVFAVALVVGMQLFHLAERIWAAQAEVPAEPASPDAMGGA